MQSFICIEEVGLNRETQRLNKYGYTEFYQKVNFIFYIPKQKITILCMNYMSLSLVTE